MVPQPMRLVFWRHGETEFNAAGRFQGRIDIPLNEVGQAQAKAAAQELLRWQPTRIIASPLLRAQETAAALGRLAEVEVTEDHGLIERNFGVFEGRSQAELQVDHPEFLQEWRATGDCPRGGVETREDVGVRVREALANQLAQLAAGGTLVLVAHSATMSQATAAVLGHPAGTWDPTWRLGNARWSVFEKVGQTWQAVGLNQGPAGA